MLRESELARRTESGNIEIRPTAMRLRWELTDLTTADGHVARGFFTTSTRALSVPTELKMLEEALLASRSIATSADVIAHFAEPLLAAARKYARTVQAQNFLADEGRQSLAATLMEAASAVAFACGIEMLQPTQVELDCPTLARQQMEELDRQAAQRRAADQVDSLRRSAELFKQFETVRAAAPELSASQVLNRMAATDQADVFRAMVLASAQNSARSRLWAVAGNSLVRVVGDESIRAEIVPIPANLGPLRSVRSDGTGSLLLGCQSGVMRLNPDSPSDCTEFRDPEVTSRQGFNAAVILGNQLWATHGEAGLVCWTLDQPDKPAIAIRPAAAKIPGFSPRNPARLDSSRLLFSSAGQLAIATAAGEITPLSSPAADILAIVTGTRRILTAHSDGQICAWSPSALQSECAERRAGRIVAASILPWMGDIRLLLATDDGPILCIGPDDELVTQYTSIYPGLRIAAGATTAVAAVTADRQRLILWHPWDARKPYADLYIYGLAKHRIADIAFA